MTSVSTTQILLNLAVLVTSLAGAVVAGAGIGRLIFGPFRRTARMTQREAIDDQYRRDSWHLTIGGALMVVLANALIWSLYSTIW